jgi:hypothetical protein
MLVRSLTQAPNVHWMLADRSEQNGSCDPRWCLCEECTLSALCPYSCTAAPMNFEEFHSALRALATLNMQDLVDADAIDQFDDLAWNAFQADPLLWILRADQRRSAALWEALRLRANCLPLTLHKTDRQLTPANTKIVQFAPRKKHTRF